VTVGGITAEKQAVEVAKTVSSSFVSNDALDGLLGLSFSSLNSVKPKQQLTFLDSVKPQLALPLVAADLKHLEPGSYDFGYLDFTKYKAPIAYTPVQLSYRRSANGQGFYGYWNFSTTSYQVGSSAPKNTTRFGIADTGTTLLYLDQDIVEDYYSQVLAAEYVDMLGAYVFPCTDTLPEYTFTPFKTTMKVTIKGNDINYTSLQNILTDTSRLSPALNALGPAGICIGGMQPVPAGLPNIYGDIFMKSVYTIFESSDPPVLGFAAKSN
jgi:aspergillopepsin I